MPAGERVGGASLIRYRKLSGTNEARREINRIVRERVGTAGQGREADTLVRRDNSLGTNALWTQAPDA
jgi:hypothetical protein